MENIIAELHQTLLKGIISEVGLGLEFSNSLLKVPGASNTILSIDCDYANFGKPKKLKAVSFENVKRMALENFKKAKKHTAFPFGMGISGAHYSDRNSHAWAYIKTNLGDSYIHFSISSYRDRENVMCHYAKTLQWFIGTVLLEEEITTVPSNALIDVLYSQPLLYKDYKEGLGDLDRLKLLSPQNPLLYHNGKFCRVIDYIREYRLIFSGSFNPPTKAHLEQKGCLFEISKINRQKGIIPDEDLLHRIKMLSLENIPVLITMAPFFSDKAKLLSNLNTNVTYWFVLGAEVWNQFLNDPIDSADFANIIFHVIPRDNIAIKEPSALQKIDAGVLAPLSSVGYSSTVARAGNHNMVSKKVKKYILENNLYVKA